MFFFYLIAVRSQSQHSKQCHLPLFRLQSARSEGESSGEQSCESSDEGVGRDAPAPLQHPPSQPHPHQPHPPHQSPQLHQHNMNHHPVVSHPTLNNHQMSHHQRNSPRPHERELKVRDDFESLKSSLHPHLSSLASLAQGAPLSSPSSVFALAGGGPTGGFPYAPPAFLAPAPPPPAQPAGSASSSSSEGSAAELAFNDIDDFIVTTKDNRYYDT
ncbi:unnamed protein product [Diatraea saccharalis]|uniref:Uncharacterized protein n=1 Tax=Diatraea saccharalis TaxID=40085 RepID=A0A9P0C837_9NEOP|nr:unnamed protein product [Diatraea saccharalis]